MREAQLNQDEAPVLLNTAVQLDPYNAQADVELALGYEDDEDYPKAEKLLQQAYQVDNTYLPRWSLANYYLRRDNMAAFWSWVSKAAEMPAPDIRPLLELCWRVSPNPDQIAHAILNDNPEVLRQYVSFLIDKDQVPALAANAPRLVESGDSEKDLPLMLQGLNRLVTAGDARGAGLLWQGLRDKKWVVADASEPNNGRFSRVPLALPFDWTLPEYPGMHSWPGSSGLITEFTGTEPEECTIAEQTLLLAPGQYRLDFSYHSTDIPPGTGIRWRIVDPKRGTDLAASQELSSETVTKSSFLFSVTNESPMVRLRLGYSRPLGTTRVAGSLYISSTQIQKSAQL